MSEPISPESRADNVNDGIAFDGWADDVSEAVALGANDASQVVALERGAKDAIARRAGRIAFGLVLITGVLALAAFSYHDEARSRGPVHAWHIVVATWLGALVAARSATTIVGARSRPREGDALRRAGLA